MKLYLKLMVIGLALMSIILGLYFNFGSFVSDLYLQTQRKGAAIPADPTCPKGQYSKKTGGICSGASSDNYDYSKDRPETVIGPTGERYNVGTYDSNPNRRDEVDYTDSDVLLKPAKISYPDWVLDPKTNRDINSRSRLSNWQFRGTDDVMEDEYGLPSGMTMKDLYDTTLKSSRNFRNSGYHDEFDTSKKHEYAKKNRPSVDDLIRAPDREQRDTPTFRGSGSSEDDYLDNRLSRDYKSRERRFELPYEKSYNNESTSGYTSGVTCNNTSYDSEANPAEEDECCEGFSPFK